MSGFLFTNEPLKGDEQITVDKAHWDILVVDDEEDIHQVTKLVLSDFRFEQKPLRFHHAYSAKQAMDILNSEESISVGLIDVVMESNHAGLDLIKFIRNDMANHDIRLILRTGQPGEAPEESVIRDYDINDYKNKTELTAVKLKTLLYSALRSHRDIQTIERHKRGLERIIDASSSFLKCNNVQDFASTILSHVADVMGLTDSDIYCAAAVNKQNGAGAEFQLLAASGAGIEPEQTALPDKVKSRFIETHNRKTSSKSDHEYVGYFTSQAGLETMLYVSKKGLLQPTDCQLLAFFANNIALAYDNLNLRETMKESQKELSYILGEAVEKRSKETGSHVKRVAHYSLLLAKLYGLNDYRAEIIKLASPLHDIGKISIPDVILNKPGKLNDDEWAIMKTHAQQGYEILKNSTNDILQCGAIIAHQHHEKWDGSGYPQGLKGEQIDVAGRITALADVFDALGSVRCYKPVWKLEKILTEIKSQRGQQFDPKLVDLFVENLEQFLAIRDQYPD